MTKLDSHIYKLPGVNFRQDNTAEVVLWAPNADKAELLLVERQQILPLDKKEKGYWKLLSDEIKPGDRYKFLVDGKELPDPASKVQPDGVHGASQAVDLHNTLWTDKEWQNIPLENYLIYELHTGTFTPEGTFKAIESKLEHLKSLGITAIEIMPVAQFPGGRNWGYDGVFPYAVQNTYGGAQGLIELVDACHKQGLAVILDVVYNHVGPEGNYFNEFGPYFTEKYNTPWGNAINFDDAWCDEVRQYFIQNVLMWFRDFHIDALRMDAVHAIKDFSPKHILQEMKEAVDHLMAETGRTHYLIIEFDLNDKRFIDPIEKHGFGIDAQWADEFHHALRVTAGGERNGYYADFNGIAQLAKSYRDAYVYDGIYSPHRLKTFGTKVTDNPGQQFVVFSQNHDHVGNRMLGERTSTLFSFEMQKLMAAAVMVSPYLPMLFMGEEWGELNPFQYFVSHTDEDLIAAVRKGRKAEFASFHLDGEAPDPQSEETFEQSKLNWERLSEKKHQTMMHYYKSLIALRKNSPALHKLNRKNLLVECDEKQQILQLHRWDDNQHVYCFMNFSKQPQPIVLPAGEGNLHLVFNSSSAEFGGTSKESPASGSGSPNPIIQPESIIIYTN
jgi:maltooligosyltrehalose trehalohydrolase